MTYAVEAHEKGERFKYLMRRLISHRVWKIPEAITKASEAVEAAAKAHPNNEATQAWAAHWRTILSKPRGEICAEIASRNFSARDRISGHPFNQDITGIDFTDPDLRKRLIRKAGEGIRLLNERMVERNDPLANTQWLWSDLNKRFEDKPQSAVGRRI
jgi:hypothetical protein